MGYGQFRDYYVDALAAGDGSGSSPTNASTFLANNSIFTTDVGSNMVRAWVRRTHVETIGSGVNIGAANDLTNPKQRRQWIIGWPNSGEPYYDERPAAGISAGWDADTSARAINTTYGLNWPTLTSSAGGLRFRDGCIVANMNLDYKNTSNIGAVMINLGDASFFTNIAYTINDGPTGGLFLANGAANRYGRLWVINTPSRPAFSQINSFVADQIVVHSMSMVASGVIQTAGQPNNWYIGEIVNYSNSVDYLFGVGDRSWGMGQGGAHVNYLGRATGIKPYSGWHGFVGPQQNGTWNTLNRCDDYFGEGPVFTHGVFGPNMRLCSSGEAMYGGSRAMLVECSSWGSSWAQYGRDTQVMQPVKKFFDVVSGSPVTIFQPVYVSSTAVFSLANGTAIAWLRARGCMPHMITASHVVVGSLAQWSGSKLGGGAAWTIASTFTPTEDARVVYECAIPVLVLSADMGTNAYMLYGEPWIAQ